MKKLYGIACARRLAGRIIGLTLCAALLAGCSLQTAWDSLLGRTPVQEAASSEAEESTGLQDGIPHADVAFEKMETFSYDSTAFAAQAQAVAAFAQGGSQQDFDAADEALETQLNKILTQREMARIRYAQDPTADSAAQQSLDAAAAAREAQYTADAALHTVAVSAQAALLESKYSAAQIRRLAAYDPASYETLTALFAQEDALVQKYETLAAKNEKNKAIRTVYVQLVQVRQKIAAAAGYASCAEYYYTEQYARSFTPRQAQTLWKTMQQDYAPVSAEHSTAVYDITDELYYGSTIDCMPDNILAALEESAPQITPELKNVLAYMQDYGLYDISRSAKKSGAQFTAYLYAYQEPFAFTTPTDDYYDYMNAFAGFGRFTGMYLHGADRFGAGASDDLVQLQGQGMEIAMLPYYGAFFGANNAEPLRDDCVLKHIDAAVEGAMFDEFQQEVYAESDLTAARVQEIYDTVSAEYGYDEYVDSDTYWMRVSSLFDAPFQSIGSTAAAIPALELYTMQRSDQEAAEQAYVCLLNADPAVCPLPQAIENAGLSDLFDAQAEQRIAQKVDALFTY